MGQSAAETENGTINHNSAVASKTEDWGLATFMIDLRDSRY